MQPNKVDDHGDWKKYIFWTEIKTSDMHRHAKISEKAVSKDHDLCTALSAFIHDYSGSHSSVYTHWGARAGNFSRESRILWFLDLFIRVLISLTYGLNHTQHNSGPSCTELLRPFVLYGKEAEPGPLANRTSARSTSILSSVWLRT